MALLATWHTNGARFVQRRALRSRFTLSAAASDDPNCDRAKSQKGKNFEDKKRRRGRPAHLRSPYDTPLRDGNRDRLIGLLTDRAARTLLCYLMETNLPLYMWLEQYVKENPIPVIGKTGNWADVSGETFLRELLMMGPQEARPNNGKDSMYDCSGSITVDPRSLAQRIMDIRTHLAKEFIQDLNNVAEENNNLLRETLQGSLTNMMSSLEDASSATSDASDDDAPAGPAAAPLHPEVAEAIQQDSKQEKAPEEVKPEQKRPRGRWSGISRQAASDAEVEQLQRKAAEQAAAAAAAEAAAAAKQQELEQQEAAQKAAGSSDAAPGDDAAKPDVADVLREQMIKARQQQGQTSVLHPEVAEMLAPGAPQEEASSTPGVYEMLMQQIRQQQGTEASPADDAPQAPGTSAGASSPAPDSAAEDDAADGKQRGDGK